MKNICLMVDYRDFSICWWDWTHKDKEGTRYNILTGSRPLYTCYKIKKSILDIYMTLISDIWACKNVFRDAKEPIIYFGKKTKMFLDQGMIFIRSNIDNDSWIVYKQNKEKGELELL